jgi:RimJ/RimL family protein N-acetyltransferase
VHKEATRVDGVVDESTDQILYRPIQADDVDRLRRLFFRLSPETILLRFFQPVRSPSERMLHHFAEVDHDAREAIVAMDGDEIIAVARYDRSSDGAHAEVAILVEDAWQGRGLGKRLLRRLTAGALEHGVTTMTATVLGENRRALHLAHSVAPTMRTHLDHGEWYIDIPISA